MNGIYFAITNNCNLKCAHCSYSSGPGEPSLTLEDANKIINNFNRKRTNHIIISGGEVFTQKDHLYSILSYIKQTPFLSRTGVTVQTNGFWAKDESIIEDVLDELVKRNVTEIDVLSSTIYHKAAGLDLTRPKLLLSKAKERRIAGRKGFFEADSSITKNVFPTGRAWDLDKNNWIYPGGSSCEDYVIFSNMSINYEGKVFPCCWMIPGTELGDAREEKIEDIFQRSLENGNLNTLIRNPSVLAEKAGFSPSEIKKIIEYTQAGPCGLCSYLSFKGLLKL